MSDALYETPARDEMFFELIHDVDEAMNYVENAATQAKDPGMHEHLGKAISDLTQVFGAPSVCSTGSDNDIVITLLFKGG